MIIACDIDGVLADLHAAWYARYNRDYQDDLTPERVTAWAVHRFVKPACGTKIYDYLTAPDLYLDVPVVRDAAAGVRRLRALGHEVAFVTSCTYGMTDQKARWLHRHGFIARPPRGNALPADLIVASAKHHIHADVLIDDAAHTIQHWVTTRLHPALLFDYPYNRSLQDEVPASFWEWCRRVHHWGDVLRWFEEH